MMRSVWVGLLLVCEAFTVPAESADRIPDHWAEIPPPSRAGQASLYDSQHRRFIIFGGRVGGVPRNDVWVLSLQGRPRWDRMVPAGDPPSPRAGSAGAYDEVKGRLIVFGGRDTSGQPLDDLWELSLRGRPAWRLVANPGPRPAGRYGGTLTFDPGAGNLVLYGGERGYGSKLGDVWTLSLQNLEWSPETPTGTPPLERSGHSAVTCPDLDGILVFGGQIYGTIPGCFFCRRLEETTEIWLLRTGSSPTWTPLNAVSTEGPCETQGHAAAWDAANHRMVVFGGQNLWRACAPGYASIWSLSVPDLKWSRVPPSEPWPRERVFSASFFDQETRSLYVHGGERSLWDGGGFADAWRLTLDPQPEWTLLAPTQPPPEFGWRGPLAALDPLRDVVVMDGGDQVWEYVLKDEAWRPVSVLGEWPSLYTHTAAVLDTKRDRLIVHGRKLSSGTAAWALTLGDVPCWTEIRAVGQPPEASAAIYDPVRDRLIIYAPQGIYALPLGSGELPGWQQLTAPPNSDPVPYLGAAAPVLVYDSKRDRMIIFGGGYCDFDGCNARSGCWAVSLHGPPAWTQLTPNHSWWDPPDPSLPTGRMDATGAYDAAGDRLIVVGGAPSNWIYHIPDDAWAMELEGGRWTHLRMELDPHPMWVLARAVHDSRRDRTLIFQDDVIWAVESSQAAGHGRAGRARLEMMSPEGDQGLTLYAPHPNPWAGELTVHLALPDATPATLELLDVSGRLIWRGSVGLLGRGTHVVRVAPAGVQPSGVYLLRLTHGITSITRKTIRLGK